MRLKVGDLVRMRENRSVIYGGQLGIVEKAEKYTHWWPYHVRFIATGERLWLAKEDLERAS